jgi:hypothetical protein
MTQPSSVKRSGRPVGIRVGGRLVVILDGRFVGKSQKVGALGADGKGGGSRPAG